MILLSVLAIIYAAGSMMWYIGVDGVVISREVVLFQGNDPIEYNMTQIVVAAGIDFVIIIPLFLSMYLNIRNINFSEYLKITLAGYDLSLYFPSASIFIKVYQNLLKTTLNKDNQEHSDETICLSRNSDQSNLTQSNDAPSHSFQENYLSIKKENSRITNNYALSFASNQQSNNS